MFCYVCASVIDLEYFAGVVIAIKNKKNNLN